MIRAVKFGNYLTDAVREMLNSKESIIHEMILTSPGFPEQYDCMDKFGNQVAYIRLRYGELRVECPDCSPVDSKGVYAAYQSDGDIRGYGNFDSDDERVLMLSVIIDRVDEYYETEFKTIRSVEVDGKPRFEKIHPEYSDQEMMQDLHAYQMSMLTPWQVMCIHSKGPALSFKECCIKIIKKHRLQRSDKFPEANGRDGLNEEHTIAETMFVQTDPEYLELVKPMCWLFTKDYSDFLDIFKECCKKGWNDLS